MIIFMYFSWVFSLIIFLYSLIFLNYSYSLVIEYNFINLNSCSIIMTFLLDWMSLLFMSFVLFISSMVIFYSFEYMENEKNLNRFIYLIIMFVFSMMMLIISPNLISILLGWDGLGLVSYCLVIFYQNEKSFNAGMITALMNRVGDVMILLAVAWMLNYGSWNFIYFIDYFKNEKSMIFISIFILIASMTKSAQIPFSSWLPAAMAAPTPVSSLVHSSTLVTAGVYLMIRFNCLFSSNLMFLLMFISTLTMFMSGLGANFEFDLKKIIALSTLSQLGLMLSILAVGDFLLSFYHLLIHALFKATLFMCAGCLIHNFSNCQDIRFMGNLILFMPLTCSYFNISNLSLCGLPFLSGFYSKDLMVEYFCCSYFNLYLYFILFFSIGLTVTYSFRLVYYIMIGYNNFYPFHMINEKNFIMLKSMGMLLLFVIFSGSMLMWVIFEVPYFICLPNKMKFLTLLVIFFGMFWGFKISKSYFLKKIVSVSYLNSFFFMGSMWNLPFLSTYGLNFHFLNLGKIYIKTIDQGWMEYLGSQNIYFNLKIYSQNLSIFMKSNIKNFLMLMILWIIMILFLF
uniref:NADH-ubiquinone oxidoreductase chain 5 n=1 Tax=Discolomatinae sp. GENSP01 TaxID=1205622 RepID=A0A0S2MNV2_9CUCU|nr:NADH deshydrogenase subunit 5 [Discolomatinae sp. GENSP01]